MLYRKPLKKRRRLVIAYDKDEQVYYVESRSRHGFYHEIHDFMCNCEAKVMGNFSNNCRHIKVLKYYIENEPWLIEQVISTIPMINH